MSWDFADADQPAIGELLPEIVVAIDYFQGRTFVALMYLLP
jgi:hypothetical protein